MIANFFHCNADNIGDQMSGPAQFIWPNNSVNLPFTDYLPDEGISLSRGILGGGLVFRQSTMTLSLILERYPKAKIAAWGIGVPLFGRRNKVVEEVARHCIAFGTRNFDWSGHLDFVPCASCMSLEFDKLPNPSHEVVFYLHRRKGERINVPEGCPVMTNGAGNFKDALEFIASGETVVTSSYHGVYWAQLLGRKVVCIPFAEKFRTFQHAPTFAEAATWKESLSQANQTDSLLDEYRALNLDFAEKVAKAWYGN